MAMIDYRDFDRDIWEKELEDFVPTVVYDMHIHMWSEAHKGTLTGPPTGLRWEIDYQDHLAWAAKLYPGREMHYLVLGTPMPGMDAEGHNDWMAAEMEADPQSEVNMMVTPEMTPDYVAAQAKKTRFLRTKTVSHVCTRSGGRSHPRFSTRILYRSRARHGAGDYDAPCQEDGAG